MGFADCAATGNAITHRARTVLGHILADDGRTMFLSYSGDAAYHAFTSRCSIEDGAYFKRPFHVFRVSPGLALHYRHTAFITEEAAHHARSNVRGRDSHAINTSRFRARATGRLRRLLSSAPY